MKSLNQFFNYMNDVSFPYVVIRNFEDLPEMKEGHNDVDILVYDYRHFREIFPKVLPTHVYPRVRHKLTIGKENIYIDVRCVSDGYFPCKFQQQILEDRILHPKGFYIPQKIHFMVALAYHVVHHKNANTYPEWLGELKVDELLKSLKESDVGYTACLDFTVGRFNEYWKGATSVVSRIDGKVVKRQTGWTGYDLIENEYLVLKDVDSDYFPKVKMVDEDIEIEDCGERLIVRNLPDDWNYQLIDILCDLKENNIKHRDIKPDNLMVKDSIIKLIDFGWATKDGIGDNPPSCLGLGYRPTDGWDDNFSMRKVIRELKYQIEELGDKA